MITIEQVTQLPKRYTFTIPEDYLDEMGHMNIRWYLGIFDDAAVHLFQQLGMTAEYFQANQSGAFALQQFIYYWREVRLGETVSIYSRILGRSAKRIHMMHFMVNETNQTLACTLESLGSHADLSIRRTSLYPPHIADNIDKMLAQHQQLNWDAPVCGAISP